MFRFLSQWKTYLSGHLWERFTESVRRTPLFYIILVLCFLTFNSFAELASEVIEGDSKDIDRFILLLMRNADDVSDPIGPRWLEEMIRDLTALGGISVLTLITLASAGYLLALKRKGQALYLLLSVGTGIVFSNLLKIGFDRPRPDLVPHDSYVAMGSFPSGHSLMAAITYLTLGALLAESHPQHRMRVYILGLAIGITILVGISRVYLGVHWPSDVVAGWLAGSAWAMMTWLVWIKGSWIKTRIFRRKQGENGP